MVLTGVYGTALSDYSVIRHGAKVAVLPREKTMPWLKGKSIPTAAKALADTRARAAANDPSAVYDVGYRHLLGIGLPQDTARGEKMIRAAAGARHTPAMVTLGDLEMVRVGGTKGKVRSLAVYDAKQWYWKALSAGSRAGGRQLLREVNTADKSADKDALADERNRIQIAMVRLPRQPFGIRQSQFEAVLRQRQAKP